MVYRSNKLMVEVVAKLFRFDVVPHAVTRALDPSRGIPAEGNSRDVAR